MDRFGLHAAVPDFRISAVAVAVALSLAVPAAAGTASIEALYSHALSFPSPSSFTPPAVGPAAPFRPGLPPSPGVLLAPGSGERFPARVLAVLDGDTVEVKAAGRALRLRLSEIDAPEKTQPFGPEAKARLESLVGSREVEVQIKETDRYGRSVSWLFIGGEEVAPILLREGLVWWYRAYSQDASLGGLEREARDARRGLWSQENPEAPWDYRRRQRASRPNDVEDPYETDPMEGHEDVGHSPFAVPMRR